MGDLQMRLLWALVVLGLTLFALSWTPNLAGYRRQESRWLLRVLGIVLTGLGLALLAMRA